MIMIATTPYEPITVRITATRLISATCSLGSYSAEIEPRVPAATNARDAVKHLCVKVGWEGRWVGGLDESGTWTFLRVD